MVRACKAEAAKTKKLLQDLQTTLKSNAVEVEQLGLEQLASRAELESACAKLQTQLQPRIQAAIQRIQQSQSLRDACSRGLELLERSRELDIMLAQAKAPRKKVRADSPSFTTVSVGEAEQLSKDVEGLLRAWCFPKLDRVTFSEETQDVVISGQPRGSHGKGVRAITRAAFNLALLQLCTREERPFPGVVLIDSPLVVYREPDAEEGGFPHEVKDAFYRSIAATFQDTQVIILENDAPPESILGFANVVAFTGNESGRYGFIPTL